MVHFPISVPVPAPESVNPTELAWAAGFFDGEGHTGLVGKGAQITVANTNRSLLERFVAAVGRGVISDNRPTSNPNWQRRYDFRAWRQEDVRHILDVLWPFLSAAKKNQALRVLALRAMTHSIWPRGRHPHNPMLRDPVAMGRMRKPRPSKYLGLSCSDETCDRQPVSRGMCDKHYLHWYRARRREETHEEA